MTEPIWYTVKFIKRCSHQWRFWRVIAATPEEAAGKVRDYGVPVYVAQDGVVKWINENPDDVRFLESAK